jgi:site-specific DNA recombinase
LPLPTAIIETDDAVSPSADSTAVIYLRVSSDGQVNKAHDPEGYSIPTQREGCLRHAERLGARVVDEFVELGRTATNLRRPALQEMLAALPKLRPTYVIFYDLSRWAKEEQDAFWLLAEIKRHGAKLESTLERIDDSPTGLLLYTIMAGVNAFRSRGDGEKVKGGLARKHETGGSMGPARIGYLNVDEMVEGRRVASISIDPDRVDLVRLAFELAATGAHTITTLTEMLEELGLRTRGTYKRPSKPLSRSMVHRLLRDDYYIGIVTLKGVKRLGRHEPIIDRDTFERVQQILSAHHASGDRSHKHSHHLIGSLHCGVCRKRLGFNRTRGNGGLYEYFACLSRVERKGRCSAPHFRAHAIERAVERKYKAFLLKPGEQTVIRKTLLARAHATTATARKDADRHDRRVRELMDHQQKLVDLYFENGVSKEVLQDKQRRLEAEQATAQRLADAARFEISELEQALSDALLLIDARLVPYVTGSSTEKRLINLAIYMMLLVSELGDIQAEPTALYADLVPLARKLAREAAQDGQTARRQGTCPQTNRGPILRGHGLKSVQMAERVGFEPTIRSPAYTLSKRAPSATRPPLRNRCATRKL